MQVTIKNKHGKVKLTNGGGRARLKRKRTGSVGKKVKKSKRAAG